MPQHEFPGATRQSKKPSLRSAPQAVLDALSAHELRSLTDLLLGREPPRLRVVNGGKGSVPNNPRKR